MSVHLQAMNTQLLCVALQVASAPGLHASAWAAEKQKCGSVAPSWQGGSLSGDALHTLQEATRHGHMC